MLCAAYQADDDQDDSDDEQYMDQKSNAWKANEPQQP
jgi:hypothetical protein